MNTQDYNDRLYNTNGNTAIVLGIIITIPIYFGFDFYEKWGFSRSIFFAFLVGTIIALLIFGVLRFFMRRSEVVIKASSHLDLQNMRLGNLNDYLNKSLNKRVPRTIFFKNRDSAVISLDVQRQIELKEQIDTFAEVSDAWKNLRAADIITNEYISILADQKREKAKGELKLIARQYRAAIETLDHIHELNSAEINDVKVETTLKDLRTRAEVNFLNAKSEKERALTAIIRDMLNKDGVLSEMGSNTRAYVISTTLNPEGAQFEDFEIKDLLAEQQRIENKIKTQQLRKETSQADIERSSANLSVSRDKKQKQDESDDKSN